MCASEFKSRDGSQVDVVTMKRQLTQHLRSSGSNSSRLQLVAAEVAPRDVACSTHAFLSTDAR